MGWKRKRLEAMADEDLSDVHLVGTDGEEVPCCKAFLASISPVFKSMFFRGFREQNTNRCNLDFHSLVISLTVKYCYCGELDLDLIFGKNRPLQEEASLLVDVREAGRYFEIDDLSSAAEAKMGELVFHTEDSKKYQYASAFLTELFKRDEDEEPLGLTLYHFATRYQMECFGPRAAENDNIEIYHAHPTVLSRVLRNSKDTYLTARCIQAWCSSAENSYSDEQKQALTEVAEQLDLKRLSTRTLSDLEPCALIPSERILQAFVHHCKGRTTLVPEKAPKTKIRLHISGADMEYLNGTYKRMKRVKVTVITFFKQVEHNGVSCMSIVHRKHAENKWFLSITKNDVSIRVNENGEVEESSIQEHVYKCQALPTGDPKVPPFNRWERIGGNGGALFVAYMQ